MNRIALSLVFVVVPLASFAACGGAGPTPSTPTPTSSASESEAPTTASSAVASSDFASTVIAAPSPSTSSVDDDRYDDPNESATTVSMPAKLTGKPSFPSAKASEADCWKKVSLTGAHKADYAAIVAACGTPTGAVEYASAVEGRLHSVKDKRDTFSIKLQGGLCYRFFGVADASIADLDIVILTADGSLIGEDKVTGPVAIVLPNKALCIADDVEYQFHVEVDGVGKGGYSFGAWARKK